MKQVSILKLILFMSLFHLASSGVFAQNFRLTGKALPGYSSPELNKNFERSTVFQIDLSQILNNASKVRGTASLRIDFEGIPSLETVLEPNKIVADNYTTVIGTDHGPQINHERPNLYPFLSKRDPASQSDVAITFGEGFLYGFFEANDRSWYIEPLRYYDRNQAKDLFVVYEKADVIESHESVCGMIELEHLNEEVHDRGPAGPGPEPTLCGPPELELAIANKWNMVTFYGTAADVINHNIGLYNAAQANWDDEFVVPVLFKIVTQFVPATSFNDPFSNTTNGHALLGELQAWAEAGGFGTLSYDLGHVRTSTILYNPTGQVLAGATYFSQLCTSGRYSSFSEYNFSACQLRHVTSHEMGHSFSANHYTSPYNIMAPSLSTCSNIWHVSAIAAINNMIQNNACLSPSQSCPVPKSVKMPTQFAVLCTGVTECVTLDENPCIASYKIINNDPNLVITLNGNTICITANSEVSGPTAIMVIPLDYCGHSAVIPPNEPSPWTWLMNVDPECLHEGGAGNRNTNTNQNELSVYQSQDVLNVVDLASTLRNKEIQIFDMSGRLLLEAQSADAVHQILLDQMPAGILVVKVNAGAEVVTKRITKF